MGTVGMRILDTSSSACGVARGHQSLSKLRAYLLDPGRAVRLCSATEQGPHADSLDLLSQESRLSTKVLNYKDVKFDLLLQRLIYNNDTVIMGDAFSPCA